MEDIVKRRLVLAKEFYENATIMANRTDALGKMMAVHNFHISIEIVLKAIALKYELNNHQLKQVGSY